MEEIQPLAILDIKSVFQAFFLSFCVFFIIIHLVKVAYDFEDPGCPTLYEPCASRGTNDLLLQLRIHLKHAFASC